MRFFVEVDKEFQNRAESIQISSFFFAKMNKDYKKGASNCGIDKIAQSHAVSETPAATTMRADSENVPSKMTCPRRGDACRMPT